MEKSKKEELMDKYIFDELSSADQKLVERLIKTDSDFRSELNYRKDIAETATYIAEKELRLRLDRIHNEVVTKSSPNVIKLWSLRAAMIGLAVCCMALFYFQLSKSSALSGAEIYAANFTPYEISSEDRGKTDATSTTKEFSSLYKDKKYAEAIVFAKQDINLLNDESKLAASNAAIETGDFPFAKQLLKDVIDKKNYYFVDHAHWYLAMTYLKEGDTQNAISELKILASDPDADYHEKSKQILDLIEHPEN